MDARASMQRVVSWSILNVTSPAHANQSSVVRQPIKHAITCHKQMMNCLEHSTSSESSMTQNNTDLGMAKLHAYSLGKTSKWIAARR
jgi:hypothetical protein